jgi:hypothetical protein
MEEKSVLSKAGWPLVIGLAVIGVLVLGWIVLKGSSTIG